MDFSLSEEQALLRDSVDKYVREHCGVERHRALCKTELGFDAAAWQQFAQLGWLSIPFSEELGGIAGSATDLMVMGEALGKGLVREPFLSTVVTCGSFLQLGGSPAQQQRYIPPIIGGAAQWAFAFAEEHGGYDLSRVNTSARRSGDSFILNGKKFAVLNAHCAQHLLVPARSRGSLGDHTGITLFIVDADAPGVGREGFVAVDGSRGAHIHLDGVAVGDERILGSVDHGFSLMRAVIDIAIVALGGEALGSMQALLDTTVDYTKTREQFGQPICKFQVLQHRMAHGQQKQRSTQEMSIHCIMSSAFLVRF